MIKQTILENNISIKIWTDDIEQEAISQLKNLTTLPGVIDIAVMPDVHAGKGSTVGTVLVTENMVIPSAVGADISCGMKAIKLSCKIEKLLPHLESIKKIIERNVPVGFNQNIKTTDFIELKFKELGQLHSITDETRLLKALMQLKTLGGGNHFIEVCQDLQGDAWIMCHTGSRNIGKCVADYYIKEASELMTNSGVNLIDKDLAYLTKDDQLFQQYLDDILWCKNYAYLNRDLILNEVISSINQSLYGFKNISLHDVYSCLEVHCNHNYAGAEVHGDRLVFVTRKGAVGLKEGELGIIPGSMGAKSFIVKGLGNDKAYDSCSHGAGRKMSRTKAKKLFNKEDLANQTSGVLCRKDDKVVDEIPGAYKNIDDVMLNQSDLVVPVFQLKQLICIKG